MANLFGIEEFKDGRATLRSMLDKIVNNIKK